MRQGILRQLNSKPKHAKSKEEFLNVENIPLLTSPTRAGIDGSERKTAKPKNPIRRLSNYEISVIVMSPEIVTGAPGTGAFAHLADTLTIDMSDLSSQAGPSLEAPSAPDSLIVNLTLTVSVDPTLSSPTNVNVALEATVPVLLSSLMS